MTAATIPGRQPLAREIGVALALSLAGAALFAALAPVLTMGPALRVLVMLLAAVYVACLLASSAQRVGRVATVVIWSVAALVLWFATPPFSLYVLVHVGMLWMVRSLYRYSGPLPVLADLALNVLALAFAYWAATRTGSTFLALWCFFLVQALFVLIPKSMRSPGTRSASESHNDEAFSRAHQAAEAALRRLATTR